MSLEEADGARPIYYLGLDTRICKGLLDEPITGYLEDGSPLPALVDLGHAYDQLQFISSLVRHP